MSDRTNPSGCRQQVTLSAQGWQRLQAAEQRVASRRN